VLALEHVGSNTERLRRGGPRTTQTLMDMIVDREEVLGRPWMSALRSIVSRTGTDRIPSFAASSM
jgi:hypothetical protein